jgi:uncharacterized protein
MNHHRQIFADSGFWLAWLNSDDVFHAKARRLNRDMRRPLVTTDAVLTEVANSMARPPRRAMAVEFLHRIRTNPLIEVVPVERELFARAVSFYAARPDKDWGLTDCISFVVMQERGITDALAADIHFVQAGFRALLRE